MKKIILIALLFMFNQLLIGQVSADFSFGSQRTKVYNDEKSRINNFSICPTLRYQYEKWFCRISYNLGLTKPFTYTGYTEQYNSTGYFYSTPTTIKGEFKESGFGFGAGVTLGEPDSRTIPYLMMDGFKFKSTLVFENKGTDPVYSESGNSNTPLNGHSFLYEYSQVRFIAGFQFLIKRNLTLFNEASINLNLNDNLYYYSFAVNLGLRYFIVKAQ